MDDNRAIAIICCGNGLGHTKRMLWLANELVSRNIKITMFLSKYSFVKLVHIKKNNLLNFKFFDGKIIEKGSVRKISTIPSEVKNIKKYPVVVCDNLLEILEIRNDAILFANFFWHMIFDNVSKCYVEYCKSLLNIYKPIIFGSEIFAADYVKSIKSFQPIGLFGGKSSNNNFKSKENKAILISTGSSDFAPYLDKIVVSILEKLNGNYSCVYVEPRIIENLKIDKAIRKANFTDDMYLQCVYAIVRPGIGTLTDCLRNKVFPICIYESKNKEMDHNSKILINKGLGLSLPLSNNLGNDLLKIIQKDPPKDFAKTLLKLDFTGEKVLANFLESKFNL